MKTAHPTISFDERFAPWRTQVEDLLSDSLTLGPRVPSRIVDAMRYTVMAPGKRFRPILVLAACEAANGNLEWALPAAAAVEVIHSYTLIHDDLPVMDNALYRRGQLTNHKVFGDTLAILAGDALNTLAFQIIGERNQALGVPADLTVRTMTELARALGVEGVVGGQVVDIESVGKQLDLETITYIHLSKTAALFEAAVRSGGILGKASESQLEALTRYARHLGLAFQIVDDLLDVEGHTGTTGKDTGLDAQAGKPTFPAVAGVAVARQWALREADDARSALTPLGKSAQTLRDIVDYVIERES